MLSIAKKAALPSKSAVRAVARQLQLEIRRYIEAWLLQEGSGENFFKKQTRGR